MKTDLREVESERLNALRRYQILDTPPEPAFDRIAEMAANFFNVPMAGVSLVDEDRVWFKSRVGINFPQTARDAGLCSSAMISQGVYHLSDAAHDQRALGHSFVAEFGIRFYAAAPIRTHESLNLGTVWVLDQKPRELAPGEGEMLLALAALAMNQMELRLYAEKVASLEHAERTIGEQLRDANHRLAQSEEQFRDLFEEAPIAYVHQAIDTRILRANRTALKILGVKPEELPGLLGTSFFPDTPEAQRRLRDALPLLATGTDEKGVVLELRRKDDGRPLWVRWWCRPEPTGKYTRSMFMDITDQVLMEQEKARLEAQNAYLLDEIRTEQNFGDIIGRSSSLRKVMQQVQLVAPTDATVLITGESGTGKELIARAIHEQSARRERPLVKLNCSAVPEGLFESEFFGHVKGAFTGALKDKPGRFELADGGTLFLDEIGEVPLAMQAKLLRVLQEQELERVGDTRTRKVNVRIIAASNRDQKKEVDEGRFRQDLFYRLSVFPIEVPPLRERREDIAPLVAHFVRRSARRMNRPEPQLSKTALDQLAAYHWPGNVRELQNTVERAIILWSGGPLTFDLPASPAHRDTGSAKATEKATLVTRDELKRQERDTIINALKQSGGKVSGRNGAAQLLGMKPSTLASRISSLGISRRPLS
ncbi:MAG TPA: sigma 54-interacting transcriptional regulator [Candidatus Binataceae bacterium]|nr:sigma 54-interacting transcriptional regulator [Candidatus Binataceae bacterium]